MIEFFFSDTELLYTTLSNILHFTSKINSNLQNQGGKTYIAYLQNDLNLSTIFPHQTMVISFYSTHMCAWALNQTPSRGHGVSEQSPKWNIYCLCKISAAYLISNQNLLTLQTSDCLPHHPPAPPPTPPPAFLPFYWRTPGPQKDSILVTIKSSIIYTVPTHGAFDLDSHKCKIAAQSHLEKSTNTEST